ncbi:hypothetical protein BDR26DRAFT_865928 [Obelidium mucronatum]|nr:hypothetical protein BDR26DRAFT_865928 [Obelidium mucronatum]
MFFFVLACVACLVVAIRFVQWKREHGGDFNPAYEGFADSLRSDAAWLLRATVEAARGGAAQLRAWRDGGFAAPWLANSGAGGFVRTAAAPRTAPSGRYSFLFDDVSDCDDRDPATPRAFAASLDLDVDLDLELGARPKTVRELDAGQLPPVATTVNAPAASAKQLLSDLFDEQNQREDNSSGQSLVNL